MTSIIFIWLGVFVALVILTLFIGFIIHIAISGLDDDDIGITMAIIIGVLLGVLTYFIVPLISEV